MAGESARERADRARAKAERLARYAEDWEKGAEGESRTAERLGRLGAEWTCLHDLKWPGRQLANIDHIAVGPGGIFVIDSKNWSGRVAVKDGVLRQNGYQRETAVVGCAESALAVGSLVPEYLEAVKPVLCFTRDDPVEGWARDVMLCSTENLVEMLMGRPALLSDVEVTAIAARLRASVATKTSGDGRSFTSRRGSRPSVVRTPSLSTRPRSEPTGKRLPRFFVGLGIWFCFMIVIGAVLSGNPGLANDAITPAAFVAGLVSWLLARRIVK